MRPAADEKLEQVLRIHFDPAGGSRYWLQKEKELGFRVLKEVRSVVDLWKLGPMCQEDLAERPVADFIPKRFLDADRPVVYAETGGATGTPKATGYFEDEFEKVFVGAFLNVAEANGFSGRGAWLWIGPGGPHIIGKAAHAIARRLSGADPFSIDFDPRWYRRLEPGSFARRRYLEHLLEQSSRVLAREPVEYLFVTPVVLDALGERMTGPMRARVRGVYLGGMAVEEDVLRRLCGAFSGAKFLSGYGNTLFGVCHAAGDLRGGAPAVRYFAQSERLVLKLVPEAEGLPDAERLRAEVPYGAEGQVMFHRLDESCFLPNVLERDGGTRVAASDRERELGFAPDGVAHPSPLKRRAFAVDAGIY